MSRIWLFTVRTVAEQRINRRRRYAKFSESGSQIVPLGIHPIHMSLGSEALQGFYPHRDGITCLIHKVESLSLPSELREHLMKLSQMLQVRIDLASGNCWNPYDARGVVAVRIV